MFLEARFDPGGEIRDLPGIDRTPAAARLAGISEDEAMRLMKGDNEAFNAALTWWFRVVNDRKWELMISGELALNHLLEKVRQPIDKELDDDKALRAYQLKNDCYVRAAEMMKMQDALMEDFGDEDSMDAVRAATGHQVSLSPEAMARRYGGG